MPDEEGESCVGSCLKCLGIGFVILLGFFAAFSGLIVLQDYLPASWIGPYWGIIAIFVTVVSAYVGRNSPSP